MIFNKYNRAKKAIAKLQKKYNISDCKGKEGTITYQTFCLFSYGYIGNVSESTFNHIINTRGEANLRLELYELFIVSDKKMKIATVSFVLALCATIAFMITV